MTGITHFDTREFIGWDGEGITFQESGPQSYVLFGASTGDYLAVDNERTLSFDECIELILKVDKENPDCIHIGFAFNYDVNMMMQSLPFIYLKMLYENNRFNYKGRNGRDYFIKWIPKKMLQISTKGQSVIIYDIFSFFQTSFVNALRGLFKEEQYADIINMIEEGKKDRGYFNLSTLHRTTMPYMQAELKMLKKMATRLRELFHKLDMDIRQWHGPGAISSYLLKSNGVHEHMKTPPDQVIEASTYAYAGGRFELLQAGRIEGPIWSIDINSAYPAAMATLPSLKGKWVYHESEEDLSQKVFMPRMGLHYIHLEHRDWHYPLVRNHPIAPLYHRDTQGLISFPWITEGWYWTPEVRNITPLFNMKGCDNLVATRHAMWEFIPDNPDLRPFSWINEMYETRLAYKKEGKLEQLALKLGLNSLYGKLAQRVGWSTKDNKGPPWHQLEWAGYITSWCRGMMYDIAMTLGPSHIIGFETDGLYCTTDPTEKLKSMIGTGLGQLDVKQYDEIIYLQSGAYFLRSGNEWISKYRGLDKGSLDVNYIIEQLQTPDGWNELKGTVTRFTGLGESLRLAGRDIKKFREVFCSWEQNVPREISIGGPVKRVHAPWICQECLEGKNFYETPHKLIIGGNAKSTSGYISNPHDLPWRPAPEYPWRQGQLEFRFT